jgi:type IV fimbrial biogenesis protein FimT
MLKPPRHTYSAGISLVEIAVTLTVLSVLLGMIVPSVTAWMGNARIRSSAESLLAGLQQARIEAVRRNRDVSFWLVSESSTGVLDSNCVLANTSLSWVSSVSSPAGLCAADPSLTVAPMLVTEQAAGTTGGRVVANAVNANGTAATNVRFNGFGEVSGTVGGEQPIARIDLDNIVSGSDFRRLRIQIQGTQIRLCEPDVVATGDPRRCN